MTTWLDPSPVLFGHCTWYWFISRTRVSSGMEIPRVERYGWDPITLGVCIVSCVRIWVRGKKLLGHRIQARAMVLRCLPLTKLHRRRAMQRQRWVMSWQCRSSTRTLPPLLMARTRLARSGRRRRTRSGWPRYRHVVRSSDNVVASTASELCCHVLLKTFLEWLVSWALGRHAFLSHLPYFVDIFKLNNIWMLFSSNDYEMTDLKKLQVITRWSR